MFSDTISHDTVSLGGLTPALQTPLPDSLVTNHFTQVYFVQGYLSIVIPDDRKHVWYTAETCGDQLLILILVKITKYVQFFTKIFEN